MSTQRPLIVCTNDDGIKSPGLWAAAQALEACGDVLVVAPRQQQTAAGRGMPLTNEGRIYRQQFHLNGQQFEGYAVDGSPAQAVIHALLELADRQPALVVSGINYGENAGTGITASGTVGAALQAAAMGIPGLAMSQQTDVTQHLSYSNTVDFTAAAHFTRVFGEWLLHQERPDDVDVLKVDVPLGATVETPWHVTHVSHKEIYHPTAPTARKALSDVGRVSYKFAIDTTQTEPESDVYAVFEKKVVAVTPISLDLTSRINRGDFTALLNGKDLSGG
jgi:5'-nucleotidase